MKLHPTLKRDDLVEPILSYQINGDRYETTNFYEYTNNVMKLHPTLKRDDLVEPILSYQITGILFDVFNQLGPNCREQLYQQAVRIALQKTPLAFQEQIRIPIHYQGTCIAIRILDFVIEDKIVLELKVRQRFRFHDYQQVKEYLAATNSHLALLARFSTDGVHINRVLRPQLETVS